MVFVFILCALFAIVSNLLSIANVSKMGPRQTASEKVICFGAKKNCFIRRRRLFICVRLLLCATKSGDSSHDENKGRGREDVGGGEGSLAL